MQISAGNGRMARLWHTAILAKWNPIFEYIPIESQIEKFQDDYYDAIAKCHVEGESTVFIEFMLTQIDNILEELLNQMTNSTTDDAILDADGANHLRGDLFHNGGRQSFLNAVDVFFFITDIVNASVDVLHISLFSFTHSDSRPPLRFQKTLKTMLVDLVYERSIAGCYDLAVYQNMGLVHMQRL